MRAIRLRQIHETVLSEGSTSVLDLSSRLGVSEETIRRDLGELSDQGLVVRTRGGAVAPGQTLIEHPHRVRQLEQQREKRAIARAVATHLVQPGMSLALDTGSTSLEIARAVRSSPITIVTNSLPITMELLGSPCTVVMIGGIARAKSMSVSGPVAVRFAAEFHCDLALISAPAMSPERGLMDTDLEEIEVKRRFLHGAASAYAVVDHTKLGRVAFSIVCELEELAGLVTDDGADSAMLGRFQSEGLEVLVGTVTDD